MPRNHFKPFRNLGRIENEISFSDMFTEKCFEVKEICITKSSPQKGDCYAQKHTAID